MWHKHFDVNFTMVFTIIPVACLGYLMSAMATTLDAAITAQQVTYIGGIFLPLFVVLSIFNLCRISLPKWGRMLLFSVCVLVYASVLTTSHLGLFYKKMTFDIVDGEPVFVKEYGPMHTTFYILLGFFLLLGLNAIFYSLLKKKDVPRRVLALLVIPAVACVLSYFVILKFFGSNLDLVPLFYVIAQFTYLLIAYRVNLYDVSNTVIDSYVQEQKLGYASFDFRYRYLGSNDIAKELAPELNRIAVDEKFGRKPEHDEIRHYLDTFKGDNHDNKFVYTVPGAAEDGEDDRIYDVTVNFLYDGTRKRGYIITFVDDTANKKYIKLMDSYNENLKEEVEEKTKHIVEMHDNLIMSLAMIVESRDNSTGGHIMRTSEGVRILVDTITKEKALELSDEFCEDVIKAAPMHDLGKIAVDDAVLKKPGRFTDDDYDKMKRHPEEGARVIHDILLNTDDEPFKEVAENVAHYHHERWDGSGYPRGLSGEDIPIEARIMAIADVYDALVSKRVYKEPYSFEKAHSIIMEGMGSQFDPGLKEIYEKARPRLEKYYGELKE